MFTLKNFKKSLLVFMLIIGILPCMFLLSACDDKVDLSSATITLEYDSIGYTGEELKPAVTVKYEEELVDPSNYTVSYSDNVNVGTASVTLKAVDTSETFMGQVTINFVITQVSNSWATNLSMQGWTYGTTPKQPNAVPKFGTEVTYKYSTLSAPTIFTENVPTNAGQYFVKAVVAETTNYSALESNLVSFVIAKAPVAVPTIDNAVYNGTVQKAQVASSEKYDVTENNGGIEQGDNYDVVLTLKDSANYYWEGDATKSKATTTIKFVINGTVNTWKPGKSTIDMADWDYDGTAHNPTTLPESVYGTVHYEYSLTEDGQYSTTPFVNAGTYWVKAVVDALGTTYAKIETEPVSYTISKINPTFTPVANATGYYGNTLSSIDLGTGVSWDVPTTRLTANGNYTATYTQPNDPYNNYNTIGFTVAVSVTELDKVSAISTLTTDFIANYYNKYSNVANVTLANQSDFYVEAMTQPLFADSYTVNFGGNVVEANETIKVSIGNNSFLNVTKYVLTGGKLYVALPIIETEAVDGIFTFELNGITYKVKVYQDSEIEISEVALKTDTSKTGLSQTGSVSINSEKDTITLKISHRQMGVKIGYTKNETPITTGYVFTKKAYVGGETTYGITEFESDGKLLFYAGQNYADAYYEDSKTVNYSVIIPGYGCKNVTINVYVDEDNIATNAQLCAAIGTTSDNVITIKPGEFTIDQDTICPTGYTIIMCGVNMFIKDNCDLVLNAGSTAKIDTLTQFNFESESSTSGNVEMLGTLKMIIGNEEYTCILSSYYIEDKTYTGSLIKSGLTDTEEYTVTTDNGGINVGMYSVTLTAKEGYIFMQNMSNTVEVYYYIQPAKPQVASPTGLVAYLGNALYLTELPEGFSWQGDSSIIMNTVGVTEHTLCYTPEDSVNYQSVNDIKVQVETKAANKDDIKSVAELASLLRDNNITELTLTNSLVFKDVYIRIESSKTIYVNSGVTLTLAENSNIDMSGKIIFEAGSNLVRTTTDEYGGRIYTSGESIFNVRTFAELKNILNIVNGATIKLANDISDTNVVSYREFDFSGLDNFDHNATIDLNGYKILGGVLLNNYVDIEDVRHYYRLSISFVDSSQAKTGFIGTNDSDCWYGVQVTQCGKPADCLSDEKALYISLEGISAGGYYGGLYTNGYTSDVEINIYECSFEGYYEGGCLGGYLGGNNQVNIINSTFTGYSGLHIKGGTNYIANSNFVGNGADYREPSYNGNGANETGDALTIEATPGYTVLSVTIEGGSFTSENAYGIHGCATAPDGQEPDGSYVFVYITGDITYSTNLGDTQESGISLQIESGEF